MDRAFSNLVEKVEADENDKQLEELIAKKMTEGKTDGEILDEILGRGESNASKNK